MPKGKPAKEGMLISTLKAFIIVPLIFLTILGAIFLYSGLWPPMVVVESESMQHSDDTSYVGVIDTGDIVMVKKVDTYADVTTYVDGLATGHSTYGSPGDVIIFHRDGMPKPIIHRAIVMLEYNSTSGGFDVPSLARIPKELWSVTGGEKVWWDLKDTLSLYDVGHNNVRMDIDLSAMLSTMARRGNMHGGIITLGDNNWEIIEGVPVAKYDQRWMSNMAEPVTSDWIIGKARGELPWFGLLKLWFIGGLPDDVPANSQRSLIFSMGALIVVPILIDLGSTLIRKVNVRQSMRSFLDRRIKK